MHVLGRGCTGIGVRWWRELLRPCRPRSLIDPGGAWGVDAGLSLPIPSPFLQLATSASHKRLPDPTGQVPRPLAASCAVCGLPDQFVVFRCHSDPEHYRVRPIGFWASHSHALSVAP